MKLFRPIVLFLIIFLLAGCGGYVIRGKVVRGDMSMATFVRDDDTRLDETPIGSVRISVYREADKLSSHLVGSAVSTPDGSFLIELNEFGAGWMEEVWLIEASRPRYENASWMARLPSSAGDKAFLIMLAPGSGSPTRADEDLMKEMEQYR